MKAATWAKATPWPKRPQAEKGEPMKSKCLTLLLAGLLALSLCACGGTTAQTGTADIDALRTAMLDAAPADLPEMLLLDSSAAEENGDMLTVGELKLDTKKFILYKNGEEIMLTPTEFKILSLFMEKPGMVFTKAQIYQRINGDFYETDDNTMMVHISKLRDKLGDNSKSPTYIKTVRGLGYKIEKKK